MPRTTWNPQGMAMCCCWKARRVGGARRAPRLPQGWWRSLMKIQRPIKLTMQRSHQMLLCRLFLTESLGVPVQTTAQPCSLLL
uniref:Uncharacterized protein n=1 Tax=Arundo donax TaxID=35708 RepID=A0A0A9HFD9_ARUDO